MDRDRKSPGLKMLQGLIWQEGYRSGELRGQVFPDVKPALERWRAAGRGIYIFSSGSVLAQQLLFQSTNAGDLTPLIDGYFDTAVGPKQSPDSYRTIVARLDVRPRAGALRLGRRTRARRRTRSGSRHRTLRQVVLFECGSLTSRHSIVRRAGPFLLNHSSQRHSQNAY